MQTKSLYEQYANRTSTERSYLEDCTTVRGCLQMLQTDGPLICHERNLRAFDTTDNIGPPCDS